MYVYIVYESVLSQLHLSFAKCEPNRRINEGNQFCILMSMNTHACIIFSVWIWDKHGNSRVGLGNTSTSSHCCMIAIVWGADVLNRISVVILRLFLELPLFNLAGKIRRQLISHQDNRYLLVVTHDLDWGVFSCGLPHATLLS